MTPINSHSSIPNPNGIQYTSPGLAHGAYPGSPNQNTSNAESVESRNPSLNSPPRWQCASTLNNCVRAQLAVEVNTDSADADLLHIRASDETLDRYKEVIVASGWRLDNYVRNPVIQNAHQYGDIIFTIGRAEKTWVSGNALLQTWRFASNENPFAKIARDLYRGKFLQAASVGFVPVKWEDGTEKSAFTRRYTEQELIEVSAVGIPANPNALTLALKAGAVEQSDLRELFALLKHIVAADVSSRTNPSHSVLQQPAFESLARQLRDVARILKHQQQPPQGAPLQTIGGGNRKENQP